MKGFYITIKNGLIDPKHCKTIKDAVWLFMWYLDKMTIINEEIGEGKVWGGKPILYEDVNENLDISKKTYVRWVKILRDGHYIKTTRAPRGLSVTVLKAFKLFNQRSVKNDVSEKEEGKPVHDVSDKPFVTHGYTRYDASNIRQDTRQDTKTLIAAPAAVWNFKSKLEEVLQDPKRHVKIIGLYWQYKNFDFANQNIYQVNLRRSLRAAKDLTGYKDDQIVEVMDWLINETDMKWTLDTVLKYIDEDLSTLKSFKKNSKPKIYAAKQ